MFTGRTPEERSRATDDLYQQLAESDEKLYRLLHPPSTRRTQKAPSIETTIERVKVQKRVVEKQLGEAQNPTIRRQGRDETDYEFRLRGRQLRQFVERLKDELERLEDEEQRLRAQLAAGEEEATSLREWETGEGTHKRMVREWRQQKEEREREIQEWEDVHRPHGERTGLEDELERKLSLEKRSLTRSRNYDDPSSMSELPSEFGGFQTPKRLQLGPSSSPQWELSECHVCSTKDAKKKCGGCGNRVYCNEVCQTRDWKEGGHCHKCK